ncbi:hypothetical protein CEXT_193151 [Caerostris extrusa]|uniref:Derlin n=1 Tax=Caerostris extrusa TaxID=172846 RepID=A0AAV4UW71_CAEEX|nr:hypothetical protein CEXT_193151 [Caerostris extrusa]
MQLQASVAASNSAWNGFYKWTTTYYLWTTLLPGTIGHYTMLHYGLVMGDGRIDTIEFFFHILFGLYIYPCLELGQSVASATLLGMLLWIHASIFNRTKKTFLTRVPDVHRTSFTFPKKKKFHMSTEEENISQEEFQMSIEEKIHDLENVPDPVGSRDTCTNQGWAELKPFLKQTKPNLNEKCNAFQLKRRKKHTLRIRPLYSLDKMAWCCTNRRNTMIRNGNDTFLA